MKRLIITLAIALSAFVSAPLAARADYGLNDFDVTFTNADGTPATQAGSHPFAMTTSFALNYSGEGPEAFPDGRLKDLVLEQIPGLAGDTTAYPRCATVDFLTHTSAGPNECPLDTAVGVTGNALTTPGGWVGSPVFNLTPPPGVLLRLGFFATAVNVVIDVGVKPDPPFTPTVVLRNVPEPLYVFASKTQLWGNPSDPAHDRLRGACYEQFSGELPPGEEFEFESRLSKTCPVTPRAKPFLTLPTRCSGPNLTSVATDSWERPGAFRADGLPDLTDPEWFTEGVENHDSEGNPQPFTGCGRLGFKPSITAQPTTKAATSPTGLDFSLDVKDEGLTAVEGIAQSQIEKAVVTLPPGMSVNPSQAEGLEVCTEADLAEETLNAEPGDGCPQASKIGTVEVESPLVQGAIDGALYVAKPYENLAGNSLIAVYLVFKNPKLGIIVKQPLRVESDPTTGRLTTVAKDIPQLPFSHFRLHFREGTRSPLASPPTCGPHDVRAVLYPWSGGPPVESTSTFQIISGPDAGPCPPAGVPRFRPGLLAGSINNAAGHFSPFYTRLFRGDSEQEITRFQVKLPPGVIGSLAGIPSCSDAAIAAAKARERTPTGGAEELERPSCPAASAVGRTLVGSGVGPSLTYVPGRIYLAGPYHGSALSLVSITAAKAGPFDLGTVVVRFALNIDRETAAVSVDGAGSDPIPHIVNGIPVHLRDIRAYVDRPRFVLNPTSCRRTSTASTVFGSGLDFASPADDVPVTVTSPFQAADCASLGFKPKLALSLRGGKTHRGGLPAFRAVLTYPKKGSYANIAKAQVTLPSSEYLEQGHLEKVCPKSVFETGATPGQNCPANSIYGTARATTPLLDEPLEGPVFLRTGYGTTLPQLTATLNNKQIHIVLAGKIDAVHKKGSEVSRIRNTFEVVPDAPVSKFVLEMKGGSKGLLVNSTNVCKGTHRALAVFTGQNGKVHEFNPPLKPTACGKKGGKGRHGG